MPFSTEFAAVKLDAWIPGVKPSVPEPLSRESKATSEGEFTRVGTLPDGGFVESLGNTR